MTPNRRVYINLAVFAVLFLIMAGWLTRNVVSIRFIDRPYRISAEFPNAFGILPNAEVTYLGVNYGRVASVDRIEGGVRVGMDIQRNQVIPEGSTAAIFRKSAIGEQYVDFAPPPEYGLDDEGPYYDEGAVLPMEMTTVPLEFSEFLRSASALIGAVEPEAVATVLEEAATGLQGRANSLRQLTEAGDRLAATLAERTEALDRLATNNTRLTRVFTEHRGAFGQTVTDLRAVAGSLREARGDVTVLLQRGSRLLGEAADLVARQKGNLDCSLKALETVIDATTTDRQLAALRALLTIGPTAFGYAWQAREVETTGPHPGPWVRVGFVANPTHDPPTQYVPPRELPGVPEVPPCDSPLRATGIDYRPTAAGGRGAPPLPATGGTVAVVTGLAALAGALVTRRLRSSS